MRILFIVGPIYPNKLGGAEVHIVEAINKLAKKGHILDVFVGDNDDVNQIFNNKNINLHAVKYKKIKNLLSITYCLAAYKAIKSFLKKNRIDLIHAKQVFPQGLIGALIKNKFDIPFYITSQNPLAYKEELVIVSKLIPKKIITFMQNFLAPLIRYSLKRADLVAAVSKYSELRSKEMGAKKTIIIPNGIDIKLFFPKKNQPNDKFVITTTSTLIPRNGIDTLVKAFALLCKKANNYELNIAGEGPMKNEIDAIINKEKIENKVNFLGRIKHNEVPDLLNRSHVFVRPSRFEGFGSSFIEAMACKIPVVTCPVGGIVDFVFDGKTGFLVPPNSPEKLAETIEIIRNKKNQTNKIVQQAYDFVGKRYNWHDIVDKIENEYKNMV